MIPPPLPTTAPAATTWWSYWGKPAAIGAGIGAVLITLLIINAEVSR